MYVLVEFQSTDDHHKTDLSELLFDIPELYKRNSAEVRQQIIAGLLDSDGSLHSGTGTSYEFSQSLAHERLFDDFREIVLSIGLRMTKSYVTKTCVYKGVKKECPAIRGLIIGDIQILKSLPLRIAYKRLSKGQQARHDMLRFNVIPV